MQTETPSQRVDTEHRRHHASPTIPRRARHGVWPRIGRLVVLVLAVAALASCGGDPDSPLSPSAGANGAATIEGLVSGGGRSSNAFVRSATATSGGTLVVTVVGTGLTAMVGDDGRFLVTDVPPGSIQLHFTGGSIDAILSMSVDAGETVSIVVNVSGTSAVLESRSSDGSGDDSTDDESRDDRSENNPEDDGLEDNDSRDNDPEDDQSEDDDSEEDDSADDDSEDEPQDDESQDDESQDHESEDRD